MKFKNIRILRVIVGILLVLSLGSTIFLAYQNMQLKKELAKMTVVSPVPSPTSDPTSSWKTYTNNKYNISFQYPSGLISNIQDTGKMLTATFSDNAGKQLIVWSADTRSDLMDQHGFGCSKSLSNNIPISVDGHNATISSVETATNLPCSGNSDILTYFVFVKDKPLDIQYGGPKDQVSQIEFNKILSTFKFTDDTSNLQTYTNSDLGFSFKYSSDYKLVDPPQSNSIDSITPIVQLKTDIETMNGTNGTWTQYNSFGVGANNDTSGCLKTPGNAATVYQGQTMISGIQFNKWLEQGAGAGMGISSTVYKAIIKQNTCMLISLSINTSEAYNASPNTINQKVFQINESLNQILSTFQFTQ